MMTRSVVFPVLQDLTALAKELRELRQGEETSRPPVKVTDYSSSSEDSHSSEDEDGEGGANDGSVAVSDIPRIMWVAVCSQMKFNTFLPLDQRKELRHKEQGHDPPLASHTETYTLTGNLIRFACTM